MNQIQFLALLFVLTSKAFCISQKSDPAKLSITGKAEILVSADTASFKAEVSTDGVDANETLNKHSIQVAKVVEALRKINIKDHEMKTSRVSLTPSWSPRPRNPEPNWRPQVTGYTANGGISVKTTRINETGKMLAAAVDAGANSLSSISFSIKDPRPHRLNAIKQATKNAQEEADILSKAAGVRLGKISAISLQSHGIQSPRPQNWGRMAYAYETDAAPAPTVLGGMITVQASVAISWEIYNSIQNHLEEGNHTNDL